MVPEGCHTGVYEWSVKTGILTVYKLSLNAGTLSMFAHQFIKKTTRVPNKCFLYCMNTSILVIACNYHSNPCEHEDKPFSGAPSNTRRYYSHAIRILM